MTPDASAEGWSLSGWKGWAGHACAILIGFLFIVSGLWKAIDPLGWTARIEQFKVPYSLSLPFTIALAIGETWAGLMLFVPRFRRWGAILAGILLLGFMGYMGVHYTEFKNMDCSCFPMLKRAIGPEFFIGDVAMLVLAGLAGWWVRMSNGVRGALVMLGAVAVFAAASYGVSVSRLTGTKAPDSIVADGQPIALNRGKVFLYFYDPQCMHCDAAARKMSKLNWGATRVIAVPTREKQFAGAFLNDTGLKALTTLDDAPLRALFPFTDPPFGVVLENGRQLGAISRFDETEPDESLRKFGLIE